MARDVAWYVENMGLTIGGTNVLSLTKKDVPMLHIKEVFGPKISKNGYRYDTKVFAPMVQSIFELYRKVTRKHKVTNGQVNKGFAQGAICWMNGDNLDWAKYVIYYGKYATKLSETKATNLVRQLESDGVCEVK